MSFAPCTDPAPHESPTPSVTYPENWQEEETWMSARLEKLQSPVPTPTFVWGAIEGDKEDPVAQSTGSAPLLGEAVAENTTSVNSKTKSKMSNKGKRKAIRPKQTASLGEEATQSRTQSGGPPTSGPQPNHPSLEQDPPDLPLARDRDLPRSPDQEEIPISPLPRSWTSPPRTPMTVTDRAAWDRLRIEVP